MSKPRVVICLVGSMVSGKGDVAKYLQDCLGFTYESLSDRVREEADERGVERLRNHLQDIGNDLRLTYGPAVLAERTVDLLKDNDGDLVIDGVRNPGEIKYLRQMLNAKVIGVDAPKEKRLAWYLERAKKRHEDAASEEDFIKADNRDFGIGEEDSGQQVGLCLKLADYYIYNDGTKEQLYSSVERCLHDAGLYPEGAHRFREIK